MKYLKIIWLRVLVSLLTASIFSEFIYMSTGDPNKPRTNNSVVILLGGVIIYFLLTKLVKNDQGGRRL